MKNFFLTLAAITGMTITAQALTMMTHQDLKLYGINEQGALTGKVALVRVDHMNKQISMSLFQDRCNHYIPSASPMRCKAMPSKIFDFVGAFKTVNPDICGSLRLIAQNDPRSIKIGQEGKIVSPTITADLSFESIRCGGTTPKQQMSIEIKNHDGTVEYHHFTSKPAQLQ